MAGTALSVIFAFWLSHGASHAQAIALTDLAWNETRGQHCVVSRYGDHYLYQWRASRYAQLVRHAGRGCPSLEAQLRFANFELHQEPFKAFWSQPANRSVSFLRQCFALGRC